jgi:hypothetical protein
MYNQAAARRRRGETATLVRPHHVGEKHEIEHLHRSLYWSIF